MAASLVGNGGTEDVELVVQREVPSYSDCVLVIIGSVRLSRIAAHGVVVRFHQV